MAESLWLGSGELRKVQPVNIDQTHFYIASPDGSEVYFFDQTGQHISTEDAVTGVTTRLMTYDSNHRLLNLKDQFGNSTNFQRDQQSLTIVSPYGKLTRLSVDTNSGFLTAVTNPQNETYSMSYDLRGMLTSFQKPGGQKSHAEYDLNGYVIKDTGAGGDFFILVRSFDPVSLSQSVEMSTALNRQSHFKTITSHDDSSHAVVKPDGGVLKFSKVNTGSVGSTDAAGTLFTADQAADPRFSWMSPYLQNTSFQVPNSNIRGVSQNQTTVALQDPSDPFSLVSLTKKSILQNDPTRTYTSVFDAATKSWQRTSPTGRMSHETLNDQSQTAQLQAGNLLPVDFNYDSHGRLTQVNQSMRHTSFSYNLDGLLANQTDPLGQITSYEYDQAGRNTKKIFPDQSFVQLTYDSNGHLTGIIPAGRPIHLFSFNLMELISNYAPPAVRAKLMGSTFYNYNQDKQLTQIIRPDGQAIDFNYDAQKALLNSISTASGGYVYKYLPQSSLVSSLKAPSGEMLTYQYVGNMIKLVTTTGPVSSNVEYNYNVDGNLSGILVSGINSALTYDKDGLQITAGDETFSRDAAGIITSTKLGSVSGNSTTNAFGETNVASYSTTAKPLFERAYSRDNTGRIIAVSETIGNEKNQATYAYDTNGRLNRVFKNNKLVRSYFYDANGNRLAMVSGKHKITAQFDNQDRLLIYGNKKYEYSANGELIKISESESKPEHEEGEKSEEGRKNKSIQFAYDSFGNLTSVKLANGKLIDYILDGQNRRIGKKVNGILKQVFIYQSQTQIAAELDGHGKLLRRFTYGEKSNVPDYMIENGYSYRIISDQVGTPRMLVESKKGLVRKKFATMNLGCRKVIVTKMNQTVKFLSGLLVDCMIGIRG